MTAETTKKARISAKAVTTPELYSYLRRHKLCRKYIKNIDIQYSYGLRIRIDGIVQPFSGIKQSFTWYETPEGHEFWREHDKKQRAER